MAFKKNGFTLIELLVVISIIGFAAAAAIFSLLVIRTHSRDAARVANIAGIAKALALYQNESQNGFPVSAGECLNGSAGVGLELKNKNAIVKTPSDMLWPAAAPSAFDGGNNYAVSPSANFCYWYKGTANSYYVSYYLESDSKAGTAGIHVMRN